MATAAVGLAGVLIGALLNFALQRYSDNKRWEREDKLRNYDERKRAYASLLQAARKAYIYANRVDHYLADPAVEFSTEELPRDLLSLQEATQNTDDILAEIQILSSPHVYNPATTLHSAMYDLGINRTELYIGRFQGQPATKPSAAAEKFLEAVNKLQWEFIDAARHDLGQDVSFGETTKHSSATQTA